MNPPSLLCPTPHPCSLPPLPVLSPSSPPTPLLSLPVSCTPPISTPPSPHVQCHVSPSPLLSLPLTSCSLSPICSPSWSSPFLLTRFPPSLPSTSPATRHCAKRKTPSPRMLHVGRLHQPALPSQLPALTPRCQVLSELSCVNLAVSSENSTSSLQRCHHNRCEKNDTFHFTNSAQFSSLDMFCAFYIGI